MVDATALANARRCTSPRLIGELSEAHIMPVKDEAGPPRCPAGVDPCDDGGPSVVLPRRWPSAHGSPVFVLEPPGDCLVSGPRGDESATVPIAPAVPREKLRRLARFGHLAHELGTLLELAVVELRHHLRRVARERFSRAG